MEVKQTIGEIIRDRRKEMHINQRTLAMLAQMSVNTVVAIERNATDPSLSTIYKLCDVLGLEMNLSVKQKGNREISH